MANRRSPPPRPPATLETLKAMVGARFDGLPARLQAAARYLVEHPNAAAVDTIKVLADAAGVTRASFVGAYAATDLWNALAEVRDAG